MYNNKKTEYETPTATVCNLTALDIITVSDPASEDVDWELDDIL